MKFIYNNRVSRWFFKKYFGITKEVFKVDKNSIHYWIDKAKGEAQARVYQKDIISKTVIQNLQRLALLPLLLVKMPFVVFVGLTTNTSSTNNKNTFMRIYNGNTGDTNYNGSALAAIGWHTSNNQKAHAILDFTLSSGSGTISTVKFYGYLSPNDTNNFDVYCYPLTQTGWVQNGCTWNKYDGTNAWTTPGGDYNSSYIDKVGWVNNSAWYSWVLSGTGGSGTPLSLTWGSNVNILFRGLDESSGTSHMCNMDLSAGTNPPYIEITYTIVSNTFGIMGFF